MSTAPEFQLILCTAPVHQTRSDQAVQKPDWTWARVRPRASDDPETGQAPRDLTAPDTLGRPDTGSGADDVPELHV